MKIGVVGTKTTANVIRQAVENFLSNVEFIYRGSDFLYECTDMVDRLQKEGTVDAILFSGPTTYEYVLRQLVPTIPWRYPAHSRASALQALLLGMEVYRSDLRSLSVDRYEPSLIQSVLEGVGIRPDTILTPQYDFNDPHYEDHLRDFHRDAYRRGLVSLCLTSMEHIAEPLQAEGIPCVRVFPAEEVVREQIYQLQILNLSAQENRGNFAIIAIEYDFVFDDERNLPLREWEKMRYQNEFKERVYAVAQQLEAAVFEGGINYFYLILSRNTLTNVFLKSGEHWNLLQFGRRAPEYRAWLGIGVGSTMLEAKSRASMALNRSLADQAGRSYLIEDENQAAGLIEPTADSSPSGWKRLDQWAGLGPETVRRLHGVLDDHGSPITAEELAQLMHVTVRSANRLLSRLEEAGYAATVGKRSSGKGRPARVMKISLPDSLTGSAQG